MRLSMDFFGFDSFRCMHHPVPHRTSVTISRLEGLSLFRADSIAFARTRRGHVLLFMG
jgi:hypothetical protein